MPPRVPLNLPTAQKYADKIREWLSPYCHRIEIAGDVRRERPQCNGVVLVCIAKLELPPGSDNPRNLLRDFLAKYVRESEGKAEWKNLVGQHGKKGSEPLGTETRYGLFLPKCELDLYLSDKAHFVTRWIAYTGSKEHNSFMMERARKLGGNWDGHFGLSIGRDAVHLETEEQFYDALKLPFVEPKNREQDFLKTLPVA